MVEEECLYLADAMGSSGWKSCIGVVFKGVVPSSLVLHA
jgi:hypothetical protein